MIEQIMSEDGPWGMSGQGIVEETLYDVDGHQLVEVRVMLEEMVIASCWQDKRKGKAIQTYYTIPQWYVRYKKLNEIL
jgi:hypothetical protein